MGARPTPVRWPRSMRVTSAAEYAGYSKDHDFLSAVNEGIMPPPFQIGGAPAWDINDLDLAIDSIKAGAAMVDSAEQQGEAYAQKRRMAGRRG